METYEDQYCKWEMCQTVRGDLEYHKRNSGDQGEKLRGTDQVEETGDH